MDQPVMFGPVLELIRTAGTAAAPVLIAVLVAGVLSGMGQTVTSIHDPSLSQVPRLVAGGLALVLGGWWIFTMTCQFTLMVYTNLGTWLGD